jgi:hypothetical protein
MLAVETCRTDEASISRACPEVFKIGFGDELNGVSCFSVYETLQSTDFAEVW